METVKLYKKFIWCLGNGSSEDMDLFINKWVCEEGTKRQDLRKPYIALRKATNKQAKRKPKPRIIVGRCWTP